MFFLIRRKNRKKIKTNKGKMKKMKRMKGMKGMSCAKRGNALLGVASTLRRSGVFIVSSPRRYRS
jgi:hypothetical protein